MKFSELKISTPLFNAVEELGFEELTPIQEEAFPVIMSGKDMIGMAQTGTGKTLAYSLPLIQSIPFSKTATHPRALIVVPTRELVSQVVETLEQLTTYIHMSIVGVYGGVNLNTQAKNLPERIDILVATPGRLYDLVLNRAIQLKNVNKLVIDEVDVMLDLGFKFQLNNIFELLSDKRQNIMFSATMTEQVDALIHDYFSHPEKVAIALSGEPLKNIEQSAYEVKNFYTKANLLEDLVGDKKTFSKVIVFVAFKRHADKVYEHLEATYGDEIAVMHANKTQNHRQRSIEAFDSGQCRVLVTTDVMARGIDLDLVTHVINYDTPRYPENYIHRIGRTGRAKAQGKAILFYTKVEEAYKTGIEELMGMPITAIPFPEYVEVSSELLPEERPKVPELLLHPELEGEEKGAAFHEKKQKNQKSNQGGTYRKKLASKYKKPQKRGDKFQNMRKKHKKK